MTKLKNFTLDGSSLQLTGFRDQHGEDLYELSLAAQFDRRGLTRKELLAFAEGILNDVMWGGMLNTCAGDFTDDTLKLFQAGGEEDGIQLQDSSEE